MTERAWWKSGSGLAVLGIVGAGAIAIAATRGGAAAGPDAGSAAPGASVAAPERLLAEVYLSTPNATWGKIQRGVGGAVGILPATLPGVIVMLADLDVSLAGELDGGAPLAAVLAGDPMAPAIGVAMKLVDPRRGRMALSEGEQARFTTREEGELTLLVAKPNQARSRALELALTKDGYLLAARRVEDLSGLGLYAARAVAARPPPPSAVEIDIPRSALATTLAPRLDGMWKEAKTFLLAEDARMRAERGRAPDFGDPAAIVAAVEGLVRRQLAVTSDLEQVRVALDATDDALVVAATLVPHGEAGPARAWIDSMRLGDGADALALPASATIAVATRDAAAARTEQGNDFERAVMTSLGERLKDPAKLHAVVEAATAARSETFAFALTEEPRGAIVRTPLTDGAAFDRAIEGAFDLAKAEPFKELLRTREVTSTVEESTGDKLKVLRLAREVPARPPRGGRADAGAATTSTATTTVGVAWRAEGGRVTLAAGADALETWRAHATTKPLAEEPTLARFTKAIGSNVSTVIVAQPLRLDPGRVRLPAAPLAVGVGRRGKDALVQIDVSDLLIREGIRSQMGF